MKIVLGASYHQFTTYIRNRGLNRNNYLYYNGGNVDKLRGQSKDTPILFLEGWSQNTQITQEDIQFINNRFIDIKTIPEGWIYSESTFI